jgi:paraquat-inducible protein B
MSVRANPTAIGLFMVGAVILTFVGVGALAATTMFEQRDIFISYFDESVNGLQTGAPVKFQGVPVGTVTDLLIQIDQDDETFVVPVQYEIDVSELRTPNGTFVDLDDPDVLRQQIADGLRAQLQMESLVTGQLYIELSYREEAEAPAFVARPDSAYPEIPTTRSLLAALGTQAGSVVGDVLQILNRVNEMLEEVDMPQINQAVVASAQAVERLVTSEELNTAIAMVPEMAEQFNVTLDEIDRVVGRLGEAIDPLQTQMAGTMEEADLAFQAVQQAMDETRGLMTTDSGVGYRLEEALTSLGQAAEALRVLAISLERNPEMLLRGPNPPPEN